MMLAINSYLPFSIKSLKFPLADTYLKTKKLALKFFYELKSAITDYVSSAYKYWHALDGFVVRMASDAISKRYLFLSGLLKDFSRSVYERYLRLRIDNLKSENFRQKVDLKMLYEKLGFTIEQVDKEKNGKVWALAQINRFIEADALAFRSCKAHVEMLDELRIKNHSISRENKRLKQEIEQLSFLKQTKLNECFHEADFSVLKSLLSNDLLDPISTDLLFEKKLPCLRRQLVLHLKSIDHILDELPIEIPSTASIQQARVLINEHVQFFDKVIDALSILKTQNIGICQKEQVSLAIAIQELKSKLDSD